MEDDVLEPGLWLGTGNRIKSMRRFKAGWRATDSTGATYRQADHPEGLKVSLAFWADKKLTPWPHETES